MEQTQDDRGVIVFEDDARMLVVNVTDEGVILDAYNNDPDAEGHVSEPVGTMAMTADEWFDFLVAPQRLGDAKRDQERNQDGT